MGDLFSILGTLIILSLGGFLTALFVAFVIVPFANYVRNREERSETVTDRLFMNRLAGRVPACPQCGATETSHIEPVAADGDSIKVKVTTRLPVEREPANYNKVLLLYLPSAVGIGLGFMLGNAELNVLGGIFIVMSIVWGLIANSLARRLEKGQVIKCYVCGWKKA